MKSSLPQLNISFVIIFYRSMASKHFTSSSVQAQAQSRERDSQGFSNQVYQYEKGKQHPL